MKNTTFQNRLFASAIAVGLTAAAGAGIAFARSAAPTEPAPLRCVGVISYDFGADGDVDAVDTVEVSGCGGASQGRVAVRSR